MIVVTSTYLKPHEEMEPLLAEHALWLKAQHEAGHFISSLFVLKYDLLGFCPA